MYIIMLGGPGTGKGSIGGKVAEDFNLTHIATGDMFREEIKKQTELGKKMNEYISKGNLVPDEVVIGIVENRLNQPDCTNGVVLDGFPRTEKQAIALKQMLESKGKKVDAAIEINVPDEDIIKRIVNRRMCSNKECGAIYNTVFSPSKVENVCDVCGSELVKRADDNEETVRQRLAVYHKTANELLNYYKNENILFTIYPDIYSKTVFEDNIAQVESYLNKVKEVK